jgi:hypothetical protein
LQKETEIAKSVIIPYKETDSAGNESILEAKSLYNTSVLQIDEEADKDPYVKLVGKVSNFLKYDLFLCFSMKL